MDHEVFTRLPTRSRRISSRKLWRGLVYSEAASLHLAALSTTSTRIVFLLFATAILISVSSVPERLARSLDVCFFAIKDSAGVHFCAGDDAVLSHSAKDYSVHPMIAVLNERDTRLEYQVPHTHGLLPLSRIASALSAIPLLARRGVLPGLPFEAADNLQLALVPSLFDPSVSSNPFS